MTKRSGAEVLAEMLQGYGVTHVFMVPSILRRALVEMERRTTIRRVQVPATAVTDYDVRYRRKGDTAWTEHPHSGTATTATISNVLQGASWEAQVRATNSVGTGAWSAIGAGHTGPARLVRAVTAANNSGDWRRVRLFFTKVIEGAGTRTRFMVAVAGTDRTPTSATWRFEDGSEVRLGLDAAHAVQAGQSITVSYTPAGSGFKLIDADRLEIASFSNKTVTNTQPLAAPAAPTPPTVAPEANTRNLSVSWAAPATGGSAITDYDLRYYAGSADPDDDADWVEENEANGLPDSSTGTTATTFTITGLKAGTAYRVQVRAGNAQGEGAWSASGTANTNAATSSTNQAPVRMMLGATPSDTCVERTADTSYGNLDMNPAALVSLEVPQDTSGCTGSDRQAPMFSDPDGDIRKIPGTGTARVAGDAVTVTLARAVRGDESADVNYRAPTDNPLKGAATGKPAVRAFDGYHLVRVSDAGAPALLGGAVVQVSETPARSKMALYFSETLDAGSEPAAGDFAVRVGGSAVTVSGVAVAGNNVVLTLDRLAAAGTQFTVSYTPGSNPIQDLARNAAAGFRQTLRAVASGKPALQSAVADGNRIALTYDKALDPQSVPAPGAFTFHLGLLTYTVTTKDQHGMDVEVTVTNPFTVSYTVPTEAGAAATKAAAVTHKAVTNSRAGWCGVGWFDSSWVGTVIVRAKRPYATDIEPQPGWFTVTASGGPVTVTGAAYSTDDAYELKLTLDRKFAPDETVTVSYTRPERESGLWDVTGRQLENIVDRPVENVAAVPARLESAATAEDGRGLVLAFTK